MAAAAAKGDTAADHEGGHRTEIVRPAGTGVSSIRKHKKGWKSESGGRLWAWAGVMTKRLG